MQSIEDGSFVHQRTIVSGITKSVIFHYHLGLYLKARKLSVHSVIDNDDIMQTTSERGLM